MEVQREFREDLNGRVRLLTGLVAVALVVIGSGFWFVQMVQGAHYRELAENNRLRRMTVRAPRGLIYDTAGRLLVENTPSYNLLIDRSRTGDLGDSLEFAAALLDRPMEELRANLASAAEQPDYQPIPVAKALNLAEVARFSAVALEHPEFEIDVGHLRLYRHGPQMAHVIGYLGEVSEADMERAEREAGPDGEPVYQLGDLRLQQAAERAMREKVGAVIALDPRNGAVRAMVSSPAFDPNMFARSIQPDQWRALIEDDNDPLQNRVLQNAFSPGSTFKMIMASAGLQEGVITPSTTVHCGGATVIYGNVFRCWKAGGHGAVSLKRAIAQSCNVYFYHLGKALGIDRIEKYAKAFGLGSPSGIELTGEIGGIVPGQEWSLEERGHEWFPGETISVSIGQGALTVTPMQLARATAAVANGGRLVVPHLVEGRQKPEEAETLPVDDRVLALVREGMAAVMQPGGTAYWSAHIEGVEMAGKTGTTQVASGVAGNEASTPWKLRNHAWFTSFSPVEEPRLVVVVFNEHGGSGSGGAAPIAKAIYEAYYGVESGDGDSL